MLILNPRGVPILILSGEGHKQVLDLFLTAAYQLYNDKLNKNDTIPILLEERKNHKSNQKITEEEINSKSQNLKFPGKAICIEK